MSGPWWDSHVEPSLKWEEGALPPDYLIIFPKQDTPIKESLNAWFVFYGQMTIYVDVGKWFSVLIIIIWKRDPDPSVKAVYHILIY